MHPFARRRAGVLLHPTSLPGDWRQGDIGPHAYRFVDFLAAAGQGVWQMLPLGPTLDHGSPYQCLSVDAGNPLLISLDDLAARGWLAVADLERRCAGDERAARRRLLEQACAGFRARAAAAERDAHARFLAAHRHWLDDYALYCALRRDYGDADWSQWPRPLRDRDAAALEAARARHAAEIEQIVFEQFVFFEQWTALRRYANERGILVFGDVPIFVAYDSVDVWVQRSNFELDADGRPMVVAGVPPDYFSATGQRWGNPHYRWAAMEADGFAWWLRRIAGQLELFDVLRLDHFRGFEAYWEIPAEEETAIAGRWVKAPGEKLFDAVLGRYDAVPFVAEDLGMITPEVDALRERYHLPGMKILQFAFDGQAANPYLPHNHVANTVVYTGTHDNDTTVGWFEDLAEAARAYVLEYLGQPAEPMPWPLIRAAYASVAATAIVPMQDLLGLSGAHRMNTPGTIAGNWRWRFEWDWLAADAAARLRRLGECYGRL